MIFQYSFRCRACLYSSFRGVANFEKKEPPMLLKLITKIEVPLPVKLQRAVTQLVPVRPSWFTEVRVVGPLRNSRAALAGAAAVLAC